MENEIACDVKITNYVSVLSLMCYEDLIVQDCFNWIAKDK